MQRFFIGLMFGLLWVSSSTSWGGWELKLKGGKEDRSIHLVHFITPTQGWAVGWGETSFWTEDGGETWVRRPLGISPLASFPNPKDGWQPSPRVVNPMPIPYPPLGMQIPFGRSFDGGVSWTEIAGTVTKVVELNPPPNANIRFFPVQFGNALFSFLDTQRGFVTGSTVVTDKTVFLANYIARTTDGGNTWTLFLYWGKWGASGGGIRGGVQFVDAQQGWAMMGPPLALYRTHDRGQTWEVLPYPRSTDLRAYVQYLEFVTPQAGWLALLLQGLTVQWELWYTQDGGETWQVVPQTHPLGGASDVLFLTPQEGFLIFHGQAPGIVDKGFRGVLHTHDGGITWEVEFDVTFLEIPPINTVWRLMYEPLTQTLWFSGSSETLYKRTAAMVGVSPRGKLPLTWGQLKQLR